MVVPDTVPLKDYLEMQIAYEAKLRDLLQIEREKALRIKDAGDQKALELARKIDDYKEEKNNNLIHQNQQERATYATRSEIKPLLDYVASQQGRHAGLTTAWATAIAIVSLIIGVMGSRVFEGK